MSYDEPLSQLEKEQLSEKSEQGRLKELQEYIKSQNHLYDDHGSFIIGSRSHPPHYED